MTALEPHVGVSLQPDVRRDRRDPADTERLGRPRRLMLLLFGTWLLSVFDLAFTLAARSMNVLIEMNPIAGWVLEHHGDWAVVVYKVTLMAAGTAILVVYRQRKCAESAAWFLILVYSLLSVHWYSYYHGEDASEAVIEASTIIAAIPANAPATLAVPAPLDQTQTADWQSVVADALPH